MGSKIIKNVLILSVMCTLSVGIVIVFSIILDNRIDKGDDISNIIEATVIDKYNYISYNNRDRIGEEIYIIKIDGKDENKEKYEKRVRVTSIEYSKYNIGDKFNLEEHAKR